LKLLQRQLPFEPIQLRLVQSFSSLLNLSEGFDERGKPLLCLPNFAIRLGQQGKKIWPCHLCPRGPVGSEPLVYLGNPFLSLPLLG
jgi:hypothetical protein